MNLTRDQLRAARVLLHLHQDQLAKLSMVGVATIRRYEGGQDIGPLHLDALRRAVEQAGAILISGEPSAVDGPTGVGVALRLEADLPESTRLRIRGVDADGHAPAKRVDPAKAAKAGRPPKPREPRAKPDRR